MEMKTKYNYQTEEELIQNMADAGCSADMISEFLAGFAQGDKKKCLLLLDEWRKELLSEIHRDQAHIDFLNGMLSALHQASS